MGHYTWNNKEQLMLKWNWGKHVWNELVFLYKKTPVNEKSETSCLYSQNAFTSFKMSVNSMQTYPNTIKALPCIEQYMGIHAGLI